jgi:AcrR family transcriptional regulator
MSKEEVIAQLTKVFRQYGYEGATLARLSEATGLGKASLYDHFPKGKEEMAAVVLKSMSDRLEASIIEPLRSSGEPVDRIRVMTKNVDKLYSGGKQSCLLGETVKIKYHPSNLNPSSPTRQPEIRLVFYFKASALAVLALGEAKNLFHNEIQNAFNVWIDTLVQVVMEAGIDRFQAQQRAEDAILEIHGSLILA